MRRSVCLVGFILALMPPVAWGQSIFDFGANSAGGAFTGSVQFADGTQATAAGFQYAPGATLTLPDRSVWSSGGLAFPTTGRLTLPDLSVITSTGKVMAATSVLRGPDSSVWNINGLSIAAGKQITIADGSSAAPAVSFASEATTGLYRAGTADLRVSLGGNDAMRFSKSGTSPQVGVAFGSSASMATVGGVICVNTTPATTTSLVLETLATCEVLGNALSTNGKMLRVKAWGTTTANANFKRLALYYGPTEYCAQLNNTLNDGLIILDALIIRTGASTQECAGTAFAQGASGDVMNLSFKTPAEDTSVSATIYVKGETNGAIGDLTFKGMIAEVLN